MSRRLPAAPKPATWRRVAQAHRRLDRPAYAVVTRHGKRALQRELAGENGQAAKRGPFALVDQAIAPVQRRAERLMPRRRGSPSAPFQLQPAVEQRCDLPQSVNADAHRGKLDRQCNAVELAADFGKHVCVVIGHIGTMTGCRGSLHEQAYRGIAQRLD